MEHQMLRSIKGAPEESQAPRARDGPRDALLHLSKARVKHGTPRDVIQGMKHCMKDQLRAVHEQLKARLQSSLGQQQAANLEELVQSVFDAASDLGPRDSELELLRSSQAYVKPVSRQLGTCPNSGEEFVAYDTPLDKNLEAMFATGLWAEIESGAAKMMQSAAERWPDELSEAAPAFDMTRTVDDVYDGMEFRRFMRRVKIRDGQVPLVFMFYYDGLEVVNGLGHAHGTHELGCFYWALLNLTSHSRLSRSNIRLATVCYKRAIGVCGMERVVAGPSQAGECLSWVQWMKVLNRGLTLNTPDGLRVFRGGSAILSADTPAAAELRGTKKAVGPSTKSICRNCHCAQTGGAHRQPCSFLAALVEQKWKLPNRSTPFRLRSVADVKAYMAKLTDVTTGACTHAELEAWMQDQGVNTFHGALWEMPHFSMFTGCPMDMMHIWLEGVARQGLGAVCYWLKRECSADLYKLPSMIAETAKRTGRGVSDFPHLNSSRVAKLAEGSEGGLPSTDCSFPGTAAQIGHFILHMTDILRPLVPETKRGDQVWQMALKMHQIGNLLWQRSLTHQDILDLDTAIYLHDSIYLGCTFLQHLWKPKNHYLSHLPFEILQWGPPRAYWCMNFEQENQVMKEGASGNYANPVMSAAEHKSLCVALDAVEQASNIRAEQASTR